MGFYTDAHTYALMRVNTGHYRRDNKDGRKDRRITRFDIYII